MMVADDNNKEIDRYMGWNYVGEAIIHDPR
jgi:hypothetical protein